jgi:hypothetical protein
MLELSNDRCSLVCDSSTGQFELHDRKRNVTWRLDEMTRSYSVGESGPRRLPTGVYSDAFGGRAIHEEFQLPGALVTYVWELLEDGVRVTLESDTPADDIRLISLPGSFRADGVATRLAVPIMQGLLYDGRGEAFEEIHRHGGHAGFSMSMAGYLTDRGGLLLSVDDYADWKAVLGKSDGGGPYVYACAEASLGSLGYPRHARLLLTDPGVTALCKRYRRRVQERGDWKPWSEKIRERPSTERLFGSLMTFIGYNASDVDYLTGFRRLRDLGFDRAFVFPVRFNHYSQDFQMGGDAPINLDDDTILAIKALGYDVSAWTWTYEALDDGSPERQRLYRRDPSGKAKPQWKIDDQQWYVCCTSTQPDFVRSTYAGAMAEMTWAHFDVSATVGLAECYAVDHPRHHGHPMDRHADLTFLRELLGPAVNGNRPVSSEGFNDGLTTAYAIGSTKLLPSFGGSAWWTVPMTMLVYHDSMIHDWWEVHNYNAHGDFDDVLPFGRKVDGFAREKAAMDALYGSPPSVFPFGRQYKWVDKLARTTMSYSVDIDDPSVQEALSAALPVAGLHRRIGPLELVSHEFLTQDGSVQATTFADGTRVVMNLGSGAYLDGLSGPIRPLSWDAS